MKKRLSKVIMAVLGVCWIGMISGCDESGVADIVWGSARLAYGIVDVAT